MQKRFFVAAVLFWVALQVHAGTLAGKVVAIADGDTVTILDRDNRQHKIRLAGIDAPERKQPYYQASRQHLAKLAFGRQATIEWNKTDRYKRIVGNVIVAGEDVGLLQVRAGYAWWYRDYAREQSREDRIRYEAAELDARRLRRGLWQDAAPVEPKLNRRASRAK
jgi:endonuclease YncB( thermonuclease family)